MQHTCWSVNGVCLLAAMRMLAVAEPQETASLLLILTCQVAAHVSAGACVAHSGVQVDAQQPRNP